MAETVVDLDQVKFIKQLGGTEDLMWGFGTVTQIRNGQTVIISLINGDMIPYDTNNSITEKIDQIIAKYPL